MTISVNQFFSNEQLSEGFDYFQDKLHNLNTKMATCLNNGIDPLGGTKLWLLQKDYRLEQWKNFNSFVNGFVHSDRNPKDFYDKAVNLIVRLNDSDIKSLQDIDIKSLQYSDSESLQDSDSESLNSKSLTESAQGFLELFEMLVENGVPSLDDGMSSLDDRGGIHFWSGDEAREYLSNPDNYLIDVKIPAHSVMLEFARSLYPTKEDEQERYEDIRYCFIAAMSAYTASSAKGEVHVFISNQDKTGKYSMRVGNYFWNVELPVLQKLKHAEIVTKIWLHFQDNIKPSEWTQMEIESSESNNIQLVRVHRVAAKNKPNPDSSITGKPFTMEPVETPCHITLGCLRKGVQKWRAHARAHAALAQM